MSRIPWRDRIARAGQLAESISSASEVMRFYQDLLAEQESWCRPGELTGALIADRFPCLLDFLGRRASGELAAEARAIAAAGPGRWESIIYGYWAGGGSPSGNPSDEFFARAFLAPYAEAVCAEPAGPVPDTITLCPCCGRRPVVSVLRQEYEGARRSLVCSLCSWEWKFRRILCASCREENFDDLPVYSAAEFPHVRIETCRNCNSYLLSMDMTRDAEVVPAVDDIAALPLHIWARDQGYNRIQANLLGM
jgi:FdhE protein